MSRINGQKLGAWSLRLDALYCAILGVFVASNAGYLATVVAIPHTLLVGAGVAVTAWSALVLWMLARMRLRLALRLVMGVNVVAALLIAVAALAAANALAVIAVLAIAVDVALFAVSQAVAGRALAARPGSPETA